MTLRATIPFEKKTVWQDCFLMPSIFVGGHVNYSNLQFKCVFNEKKIDPNMDFFVKLERLFLDAGK